MCVSRCSHCATWFLGAYLGVDEKCLRVGVVNGVASLVVARILLDTGSSVEASNRLANVHERLVVTSTGEACSCHVYALLLEMLDEELLNGCRSRRTREVESAAIAIEDTKVAAGNHVEVEVSEDVVGFCGVQVLRVVLGSKKAVLLRAPPCESDLVLDVESPERLSNLEDECAA